MTAENIYLDDYCERSGSPDLWAEPLNMVSNLAFLGAAALLLRHFTKSKELTIKNGWDIVLSLVLLAVIGIGSFIFHIFAESWAELFDVIPIALFINVYLISFLVRIARLRWWAVIAVVAIYQGLGFVFESAFSRDTLNGTIMYIPTYLTLTLMSIWVRWKKIPYAKRYLEILLLWTISLIFRTVDIPACYIIPSGTHFLWHILNAITLYMLVKVLMAVGARKQEKLGNYSRLNN